MKYPSAVTRTAPVFLFCLVALFSACSDSVSIDTRATAAPNEFAADLSDPQIAAAVAKIDAAPDAAEGYTRLATVFIKRARETGDFALNRKADAAVDKALVLAPQDNIARKLKLSLLATFHRFPEAVELGEALLTETPNDAFIYGIMTDSHVELGNYEKAIASAQKMIDIKPNSSAFARTAHLRSLHGDHKGAVEMLEQAARTADPQDKEAQSWCLVTLAKEHFKTGDLERSAKVIDESLAISPTYQLSLIEKARISAARGELEKADRILGEIPANLLSVDGHILRGDIAARAGQVEKSQASYRSAEEAARNLEGDMHRFSLLWADNGVRLDEAIEIADTDYQTNKDIYAADIYAWCLYKKGRFDQASVVIGKALRLNSNDARILYHAGMIELALKNRVRGRELLASAIKANPHFDLLQAEIAVKTLSGS